MTAVVDHEVAMDRAAVREVDRAGAAVTPVRVVAHLLGAARGPRLGRRVEAHEGADVEGDAAAAADSVGADAGAVGVAVAARGVDGEVVDVRAFESGAVYYRILIKKSDGKLGAVILDAKSVAFMSSNWLLRLFKRSE